MIDTAVGTWLVNIYIGFSWPGRGLHFLFYEARLLNHAFAEHIAYRKVRRCVDQKATMSHNATPSTTPSSHLSFADWARKHNDTTEQRQWRKHRKQASLNTQELARAAGVSEASANDAQIPVFRYTHAPELRQSGHSDKDLADRLKVIYRKLDRTGLMRPLRHPVEDVELQLEQTAQLFPNFRCVIEQAVAPHLCLLRLGIPMPMTPILLVGPAGIGKTAFSRQLATLCNVPPPLFINIAEEDNGSALIGSSTYWSNTQPGKLFSALAWGIENADDEDLRHGCEEANCMAVANPLIVLDEIDKVVASHEKHGDPLGSLYRLLETDTSKQVQDRCLTDIRMDASHVRYVATANSLDTLPAPLLSRMDVFHIVPPNAQQRASIAQNMVAAAVEEFQLPLLPVISQEILNEIQALDPRQLQSKLRKALAFAVMSKSTALALEHWEKAVSHKNRLTKLTPGFLSRMG